MARLEIPWALGSITTFQGSWRLIVSPKLSSLAYDDLKEEEAVDLIPELNLIVSRRNWINSSLAEIKSNIVAIHGRITVSF